MKWIRKLLTLLLAVLVGFWLALSGILSGTRVGQLMETTVSYLPDANDIRRFRTSSLPLFEDIIQLGDSSDTHSENPVPTLMNKHTEVDYDTVELTIIDLVNDLRTELDRSILQSNDMLKAAAIIRARETEEKFSHTRPNGLDAFSVFSEEGIDYNYRAAGENLGMATYYMSEEEMAELIFDGWVESEGHYENMIRPDYEEIGVGVHYDGEFLYATQLFGTQH